MSQFDEFPKKEELDLNELGPEILALKHELDVLTSSLSEEEKKEAKIEPMLEKCKAILLSGKSSEDAVRKVKDIMEETVSGLKKKLTLYILSELGQLSRSADSSPLAPKKKELLAGIIQRIKLDPARPLTAAESLEALGFIVKYLEFLDEKNKNGKIQ